MVNYSCSLMWYLQKIPRKLWPTTNKDSNHAHIHVHVSAIQIHQYSIVYKLFSIFRTNRKYRSKIIYRIRTCLPFRTRIVSTNYHQRWIDDQFEEKALLKGFCDTHRERIPLYIYVLFFTNHYSFKCFFLLCHVLEYLYTCLSVCKILLRMNIWLYLNTVHFFRKLIVHFFFFVELCYLIIIKSQSNIFKSQVINRNAT